MFKMKCNRPLETSEVINESIEGDSIEKKIRKWLTTGENIKADAPILHLPRAEGVRADTDIRTDRFDIAIEASTKSSKARKAKIVEMKPKDNEGA